MLKLQNLVRGENRTRSFIQEFCTVAGTGVGISVGFTNKAIPQIHEFGDIVIRMDGPTTGVLICMMGHIAPLVLPVAEVITKRKEFAMESYFPQQAHKPSQLAGIALGVIASFAMATQIHGLPGQGKEKIKLSPVIESSSKFFADLYKNGGGVIAYSPYSLAPLYKLAPNEPK